MNRPPPPPEEPFFEMKGVSFRYGRGGEALRGVDLSVRRGELTGLIGPNGAGKSTLLRLMMGLLRPGAGSIRLGGRAVHELDPATRARCVGFVPQSPRVLFPYRVAEIVAMGRHPWRGALAEPSAGDRERIAWAMEATGVTRFAGRAFNQLSGGEAQRVILARALAQETEALVLDEPTSSLDLFHQTAIYGLLERLNAERGLTVLVVTHDINLAAEYCPRLVGMREGEITFDGAPAAMLDAGRIEALYGVQAEILCGAGGGRMVRARHFGGGER